MYFIPIIQTIFIDWVCEGTINPESFLTKENSLLALAIEEDF